MKMAKSYLWLLVVAGALLCATGSAQAAQSSPQNTKAEAVSIANQAFSYYLPTLGKDLPDWAKRIEFDVQYDGTQDPLFSILTVQPIYQTDNKIDTVFFQGSEQRYELLNDVRDVSNFGLGYRRLFLDGKALVGINSFIDHEWTYGHTRASVGGEVKWGAFDFTANKYLALTGSVAASSGTTEEALSGHDFEMRSQVPYLPWLRVGAKGYFWDNKLIQDIEGWSASFDADVSQNVTLEAGAMDDNAQSDVSGFIRLTLRPGREDRPVMMSAKPIDSKPFAMRDMASYTLDKVRRQNKILVERKGGGVVIARGN